MSGIRTVSVISGTCAGLVAGPLVWAINMQLGQLLPYVDCVSHVRSSAIVSFIAAAISVASGVWSWLFVNGRNSAVGAHAPTLRFIGLLGALMSFLFAFALSLQGVASLVLSGCER